MTFWSTSRRPRAVGGLTRPGNVANNKSPALTLCLPPDLFERLAEEASARGVPMARVVREALALKYPTSEVNP